MKNQYDNIEKAAAYDRSVRIWEDGKERVAGMALSSEMKVLDIGGGPGILALPMAKQVQEVTVVEPSAAMCDLLRKHMKEEGANNIRIIPSLWEEVPEEELEEYDLIVASYSLNMPDFLEAALKMDRHSRGEVWLYWFAGETSWEQDKRILSARLGDPTPVSCHRKIDTFYNILYKAGIYCDINMLHGTSFDREYKTFEEAVEDHRKRHGLTEDALSTLTAYLMERLESRDGTWYYRDLTHYVRMSWRAGQRLQEKNG